MRDLPIAPVTLVYGSAWFVECPYCGDEHTHGWEGQRKAHCGGGEYIVTETNDTRYEKTTLSGSGHAESATEQERRDDERENEVPKDKLLPR